MLGAGERGCGRQARRQPLGVQRRHAVFARVRPGRCDSSFKALTAPGVSLVFR